ncbi:MAG: lysine--tRNA ligase [bacterium]|nr:lysine--tRNA ligase [bacterium]
MSENEPQPLHRLVEERLRKLEALEARANPYPYRYDRTHTSAGLIADEAALTASGAEVRIAGRIMAKRSAGKTIFLPLQDGEGRIQIYARRDDLGEEDYEAFKKLLDLGDLIGVAGKLFRTNTGELTVHVSAWELLAKSLRPLPEKFHDMSLELRSRKRHLDLIMNPESRERFRRRSALLDEVRRFLIDRDFLEVETPVLQPLYGGATARPFTTHHNALDQRLYLRIADELYLKRLIVGGLERVFEFCKDFRNEGMDRTHNPEFTMMECYAAYWDYHDMMELFETLMRRLAAKFGRDGRIAYGDHELDFSGGFRRLRFLDGLRERTGVDFRGLGREEIRAHAERLGVPVRPEMGADKILDAMFGELVEPTLIQPTFVMDHPKELSPLAKGHRDDPALVERFEGFVAGFEICNSFSELNDPREQRRRFADQMDLRAKGDDEAQVMDEDYLEAMEIGMPPTGGLGVGLDRLVMLFTGCHAIRDVLLFPAMRPEE